MLVNSSFEAKQVDTSGGFDLASWNGGQSEEAEQSPKLADPHHFRSTCTMQFCARKHGGLHHAHRTILVFWLRALSSAASAVVSWLEFTLYGKDLIKSLTTFQVS